MDFFGMGPVEIIFIIVIAFIIFGPGKIVEISRGLGKTVRAFRKATSELTEQVTKELEEADKKPPAVANSTVPPTPSGPVDQTHS